MREPALLEDELEVLRREQLSNIEQTMSDPQALASNTMRRALTQYEANDPRYVPTSKESLERVKSLKIGEVREIYEKFLGGQNGELVVVGDFEPETLEPLTKTLESWKSSAPYARLKSELPAKVATGKQVIQTPDKENAIYLAAELFPLRNDDPDYPAMIVANYILGGGSLSSRLGDRVRQKEGLSYGVGSGFSAQSLDSRAAWQIQAITNPKNMAKVEEVIREELDKLLKTGVTAEEVVRAKGGYLQQQQVGRANDNRLADLLGDGLFEGRTMAFYSDLESAIGNVDVEKVNSVIRKYLTIEKMLLITAGASYKSRSHKRNTATSRQIRSTLQNQG